MNPLPFYVYAILRPDGTPCYIGKGKGNRWRHDGKYGRNLHLRRIIANAKESGQPLERIKLIENMSEADALAMESFFIAALGREANGGPLVNLTDGGEVGPSGYRHTDEYKIAASHRRKGQKYTPEWRAAISAGMKNSPKVQANVSRAGKASAGKPKSCGWWSTPEGRASHAANNKGNTGNTHTEKSLDLIRAARARQPKHVSPATQFKPGYQPSAEIRAKLSASVTASWVKRRAASLAQTLT